MSGRNLYRVSFRLAQKGLSHGSLQVEGAQARLVDPRSSEEKRLGQAVLLCLLAIQMLDGHGVTLFNFQLGHNFPL